MKGVVITLAFFFFNLLLMAVQQTFLRAVACLPVGQQHGTVRSYPRTPLPHPYCGLYLAINTEFKLYCAHYGKGLRCSLCRMPCSASPGEIWFPSSINTVSKPKQN